MSNTSLNQADSIHLDTSASVIRQSLAWRQGKLIVYQVSEQIAAPLVALKSHQVLVECLQRSPIKLVKIDLACGEPGLTFWANACLEAGKPLFLRLPSSPSLPSKRYPFYWSLKRIVDWLGALVLLLLLSPVMLVTALLLQRISPGALFSYQWCVGERGRLFRLIRFRALAISIDSLQNQHSPHKPGYQYLFDSNLIIYWMYHYRLDRFPQLLNVLRGEMSLISLTVCELEQVALIPLELRHRLNALPGVIEVYRVQQCPPAWDSQESNQRDLLYLYNWSLVVDCKNILSKVYQLFLEFISVFERPVRN